MITVHHLENSRSQRVLWLLEELGLPYAIKRYERNKTTMLAPPELRAIHPLGKSPVIVDDTADGGLGRTIAETGAIIEYLVEKADGKLGPPAHREAVLLYRHFLHYAEGSLMPPLLVKLVLGRVPLDVMMSFPLEAARSRAGLDASRPATIAWLAKVHARPAFQAALTAGGPYAYA